MTASSRTIAWLIWALASIFYAYQYVLRVMPSIMMPDITAQFHMDSALFGQFVGIYYIGYSLLQLPVGILLDRYGPKKIMPLCMLLTTVGLMPLLFTEHWAFPVIGRLLIGIGSSAAILGAFKIIRLSFQEKHFTRMLSLAVTIGLIGAIYGGGPVNYLRDTLGYEAVVGLLAGTGIILSIVTYCLVPNMPAYRVPSVLHELKLVLTNRQVLLICFFAGLMVGPLEGFADVWGTVFLKKVYGFDSTVAATLPSAIFVGMCFGAPLLSLVAEKSRRYFWTITLAGFIMTLGFFSLLTGKVGLEMMSALFVAIGVCSAYQILAIYKASTYVPEHAVGLTTATTNMIIMIFGYLFHSLIGWIVYALGDAPEAFVWGISVVPIALAIGTSGFLYLSLKHREK
jgi:predicted MFS family arabinose efflux permease